MIHIDWAQTKRVQTLLLRHIIRCRRICPTSPYPGKVWRLPLSTSNHILPSLLPSQSQIPKKLHHRERQVPLFSTLLLRGHCLNSFHWPRSWVVLRGILAPPVNDHLLKAPSPIQILPRCTNPSLARLDKHRTSLLERISIDITSNELGLKDILPSALSRPT